MSPKQMASFVESVEQDSLYVSAPFRLEARYSCQSAEEFAEMTEELDAFRQAAADADTWLLATSAQMELAKTPGVSHRVKSVDLLTAAIAHQNEVGILHYDRDYDTIASYTSLEFKSTWLAPPGSLD